MDPLLGLPEWSSYLGESLRQRYEHVMMQEKAIRTPVGCASSAKLPAPPELAGSLAWEESPQAQPVAVG